MERCCKDHNIESRRIDLLRHSLLDHHIQVHSRENHHQQIVHKDCNDDIDLLQVRSLQDRRIQALVNKLSSVLLGCSFERSDWHVAVKRVIENLYFSLNLLEDYLPLIVIQLENAFVLDDLA